MDMKGFSCFFLLVSFPLVCKTQDTQRPAYHVMPTHNWMNDPNGPFFWEVTHQYHLFFQWNPTSAVWGNMTWGHVISNDLVFWKHSEPEGAILPGPEWYDVGGVFSGSATLVPMTFVNESGAIEVEVLPLILYTCVDSKGTNRQCMALPTNWSQPKYRDPEFRFWTKFLNNPIIDAPPSKFSVPYDKFRDPATAWQGMLPSELSNDSEIWITCIGSSIMNGTMGAVLLFSSPDFERWSPLPHPLYVDVDGVFGVNIECPELFKATVLNEMR